VNVQVNKIKHDNEAVTKLTEFWNKLNIVKMLNTKGRLTF